MAFLALLRRGDAIYQAPESEDRGTEWQKWGRSPPRPDATPQNLLIAVPQKWQYG